MTSMTSALGRAELDPGLAFGTGLGEAGGVADHPAGATGSEFSHQLNSALTRHRDETGVRRSGQGLHIRVTTQALHEFVARVHRPDVSGKAELLALPNHLGRSPTAKHRHMTRRQQTP